MGLDIYLDKYGSDSMKSAKYPEHYMNPGYLRSSYNPSGFDNFVPQLTGDSEATYYNIFAEAIAATVVENRKDEEGYGYVETSWDHNALTGLANARKKALEIEEKIKASPPYGSWDIYWFEPPTLDSEKAVSTFNKVTTDNRHFNSSPPPTKEDPFFGAPYSSKDGFFYPTGLTIKAAIPTVKWGRPCVSLIYELKDGVVEHYAQAAYIVSEFAEKAIDIIRDKGSVEYVWSG